MKDSIENIDKFYETRRWIKGDTPVNNYFRDWYMKASANGLDSSYNDFLDHVIEKYNKRGKPPWDIYEAMKKDVVLFKTADYVEGVAEDVRKGRYKVVCRRAAARQRPC